MSENMNITELFATNYNSIFDRFGDSIELSSHCLKVVLSLTKKQKSLSTGYAYGETVSVPLTSAETKLKADCMKHLNAFNQTILHQLISQYQNKSSNSRLSGQSGDSEQEFPSVNEWYAVSLWSIVFVSMVLFAIFGNSLIIWIIVRQKVMRTVINIFLVNLTISDLLTVTFNASFNFVFMLTGNWPFNFHYCVFNNFINNLTIASSVFTATVMSIDRYVAIVHPLKPRMTKKRALLNIGLIWLCSAFFASPTVMYSRILTIPYNKKNERTLCLLEWPDGLPGQSKFDLGYNIAFLLLTYIIPMITMAIAYTLMARVLWDSRQNPLNSNIQDDLIRSKQKCVRMLIAVVSVFGICWLPYHSYFLSTYIWPDIIKVKQIKHIYLAIYWLAMANSLFNPVILFIMNKRFRKCISYYIRCYCFTGRAIQLEHRVSVLSTRLSASKTSPKKKKNNRDNIDLLTNGSQRNSFHYNNNPVEDEVAL